MAGRTDLNRACACVAGALFTIGSSAMKFWSIAVVAMILADEDMQKRPPLIRVQFGPASSY